MSYRVVYGETRPAWDREFPSLRAATTFARKQEACGDIIFSIVNVNAPYTQTMMQRAAELQNG